MSVEEFKAEFKQAVANLPGISSIEFFGSICEGRFRPGESDIDVFVHGWNIPSDAKREAENIFRALVSKHKLGVERAPFQHPVPLFIDNPLRQILYKAFKARIINVEGLRQWMKQTAPSHEAIWNVKDAMRDFEKNHPYLPPLSQWLDKFM